MIKSISYWSFERGLEGTHSIEEALAEAKQAGFQGIELAIGTEGVLTTESTPADCAEIRKQITRSGLTVETTATGLSWGTNPVSNDDETRARAVTLHQSALERTADLECEAMLMVPGVVKSPISPDLVRYDHALKHAAEAVERLLPTAERLGVILCLENVWNGLFYSPLELASFVDSFGSTHLGIYFDIGNVLGYHQHPPHWIELLNDRIERVHIKDYKESVGTLDGFCDLLAGDVPWAESMAALRKIGYQKTIVAEMIPYRPGQLQRTSDAMDQILAQGEGKRS